MLLRAGASKAYPETLEASLRLAAETLESLGITTAETETLLREVRSAARAVTELARTIERNPNSLLIGR